MIYGELKLHVWTFPTACKNSRQDMSASYDGNFEHVFISHQQYVVFPFVAFAITRIGSFFIEKIIIFNRETWLKVRSQTQLRIAKPTVARCQQGASFIG